MGGGTCRLRKKWGGRGLSKETEVLRLSHERRGDMGKGRTYNAIQRTFPEGPTPEKGKGDRKRHNALPVRKRRNDLGAQQTTGDIVRKKHPGVVQEREPRQGGESIWPARQKGSGT